MRSEGRRTCVLTRPSALAPRKEVVVSRSMLRALTLALSVSGLLLAQRTWAQPAPAHMPSSSPPPLMAPGQDLNLDLGVGGSATTTNKTVVPTPTITAPAVGFPPVHQPAPLPPSRPVPVRTPLPIVSAPIRLITPAPLGAETPLGP